MPEKPPPQKYYKPYNTARKGRDGNSETRTAKIHFFSTHTTKNNKKNNFFLPGKNSPTLKNFHYFCTPKNNKKNNTDYAVLTIPLLHKDRTPRTRNTRNPQTRPTAEKRSRLRPKRTQNTSIRHPQANPRPHRLQTRSPHITHSRLPRLLLTPKRHPRHQTHRRTPLLRQKHTTTLPMDRKRTRIPTILRHPRTNAMTQHIVCTMYTYIQKNALNTPQQTIKHKTNNYTTQHTIVQYSEN